MALVFVRRAAERDTRSLKRRPGATCGVRVLICASSLTCVVLPCPIQAKSGDCAFGRDRPQAIFRLTEVAMSRARSERIERAAIRGLFLCAIRRGYGKFAHP